MILFVQKNLNLAQNFYLNGLFNDLYVIVSSTSRDKRENSVGLIGSKHPQLSISVLDGIISKVELKGLSIKCTIIDFARPSSLQYYSTVPLVLDLQANNALKQDQASFKEKDHLRFKEYGRKKAQFVDIRECLEQINQLASKPRSVSIPKPISEVSLIILDMMARLIHFVIRILNTTIPVFNSSIVRISSTAQQLNLRLEQFLFWPRQYSEWYCSENKQTPLSQAQYVGFFNTFWLIANDIIIGSLFKAMIIENRQFIRRTLKTIFLDYGLSLIRSGVTWLTAWPAGLKLNSELATFLGELFIWMIFAWREILYSLEPYADILFTTVLYSTILGATFSISLLSDLLALGTLHLQLFYIVSARVYHWTLKIIGSTFNLFRGRKWNPLRKRIDSAEYDLDQLLIGAVIFTLLVFLLPTVAVYYLLFSLAVIAIVVLQSLLEIMLAVFNHFPLFAIMLRIKDPKRLPDGVYFDTPRTSWWKKSPISNTNSLLTHLELKNRPIGARTIFYQYNYLIGRLMKYYLTAENFVAFVQGIRIHGLPKLSYPTMNGLERDFQLLSNKYSE